MAAPLLQGLDDAFVSQAPIIEHEQYAEDLYDPSDPTDRQQIEWREKPRAAAAQEGVEAGSAQQQEEQQEAAAVAEGKGSPAKPASTAGEAVSIASDQQTAAPNSSACRRSCKRTPSWCSGRCASCPSAAPRRPRAARPLPFAAR